MTPTLTVDLVGTSQTTTPPATVTGSTVTISPRQKALSFIQATDALPAQTDVATSPPGASVGIDEDGQILSPFFRTGYNYDRQAASLEAGLACLDPTLTQQQFAEDADINVIVRRFGLTGQLPDNIRFPQYGDYTGINDFQTALNVLRNAEEAFMALPPEIRAEFNNSPQVFLEAVHEPKNLPRLRELGLALPEKTPPLPQGQATGAHPDKPDPSDEGAKPKGKA